MAVVLVAASEAAEAGTVVFLVVDDIVFGKAVLERAALYICFEKKHFNFFSNARDIADHTIS
jgi:hypothetical protein